MPALDPSNFSGGIPQVELQNMTNAQLIQCANVFFNAWACTKKELEGTRQKCERMSKTMREFEEQYLFQVQELTKDNSFLRQELHQSQMLGKNLQKRAIGLTLSFATANDLTPTEAALRDQLVSTQARILELERMLRGRVASEIGSVLEENAILREQRAKDIQTICALNESLAEIQNTNREASQPHSFPMSTPGSLLLSPEASAFEPVAIPLKLSKAVQTNALLPAGHRPLIGSFSGGEASMSNLQERLRLTEFALAQKEALIADLHLIPLDTTRDSESLVSANMAIHRLRRDLEEKDHAYQEVNASMQRIMDRYNQLSSEAAELRIALQETRASRAKIAAEMKESKAVPPAKLRELLKMAESVHEFEAQRAHYQERDRMCGEMEVLVGEFRKEIENQTALQKEQASAHQAVLADCDEFRSSLHRMTILNHSLSTRLSAVEFAASPKREEKSVQAELQFAEIVELKSLLTMSMNDSRYLEHEALIREQYLQGATRVAASALRDNVRARSEIVRLTLDKPIGME